MLCVCDLVVVGRLHAHVHRDDGVDSDNAVAVVTTIVSRLVDALRGSVDFAPRFDAVRALALQVPLRRRRRRRRSIDSIVGNLSVFVFF